jgi:uncharacterized protein YcbX
MQTDPSLSSGPLHVGSVAALWRYPVKSMMGEELNSCEVTDRGLLLYPQGRFEARRFRPNIVVSTGLEEQGFAENDWIGHTVAIGDNARLAITEPCPRCVMITLPQGDLPKDSGILRAAAQRNAVNVGVYASVLGGGTIRRGDAVTLA